MRDSQAAKAEKITKVTAENRADVYQRLAKRLGGDRAIYRVIFDFFGNVVRSKAAKDPKKREVYAHLAGLAVRWLKGDLLDATEAGELERPVPTGHEFA